MTTTVGDLIQRARDHSDRFTRERHNDRLLLGHLSTRHRERLRQMVEHMKDRLSEARKIADTISNSLVGVDENEVLYEISTSGDGYDVIVDANGFFYLGPTAIATDPYDSGFPLPATSLKLLDVYATMLNTGRMEPVQVVNQRDYPRRAGALLSAVINGWRLVPIINPADADQSVWDSVESVTLVWVDEPTRFTETAAWADQTLTLPDTFTDVLEADLAYLMAQREHSSDPTGTPTSVVQMFGGLVSERAALAMDAARHDHKGVRFTQSRRNR